MSSKSKNDEESEAVLAEINSESQSEKTSDRSERKKGKSVLAEINDGQKQK